MPGRPRPFRIEPAASLFPQSSTPCLSRNRFSAEHPQLVCSDRQREAQTPANRKKAKVLTDRHERLKNIVIHKRAEEARQAQTEDVVLARADKQPRRTHSWAKMYPTAEVSERVQILGNQIIHRDKHIAGQCMSNLEIAIFACSDISVITKLLDVGVTSRSRAPRFAICCSISLGTASASPRASCSSTTIPRSGGGRRSLSRY